ncbi:LLM class flavin-dependent oxidoreductase [Solibacillus sp. MA9]|uniref:LLM class flavin-dependent oxidoreductase n=1 Tax=Solibacillus palustris TaxID=2908203 RepID=A0ABS9UE58_9BACL|nr:LLM class flavin-dependent oxidoreductase [Solibacillus sp. MA9]MCH7322270.1 LLM class flavin-dependent oxidoreductase [Solibacillus sp. MA9]
MKNFEFGIYSLADIGTNPLTGETPSPSQRLREILTMADLTEQLGLDLFGVGEHHRLDYVVSAPPVVLSAISQRTKRIKLTSTTTVLSTVDPVRLFEDFATLDLLSNGRAEILAGRGAFIESFPLFGYDTKDYDALFEENLLLLQQLNSNDRVTWNGQFRSSLRNADIAPRPIQNEIPIWVGVGGTPQSAIRAGKLGVGMALAILGGPLDRFQPLVDLYREAGQTHEKILNVGVTGHLFIAETTAQAREEFYPFYKNYWQYVNQQRGGLGFQLSFEQFEEMTAPNMALFVGSPEAVAEKIIKQHQLFGHTRFLAQPDIGGLPIELIERSMKLFAEKVVPLVKNYIQQQ